jgi:hypothetical protein
LNEPHSLASFGRALRERQNRGRQIDSHYCAVRRDCPGKVQRCLTPATADIQEVLTRARCKRLQSAPAKRGELSLQRLSDFRPSEDPYFVLGQHRQRFVLVHQIIASSRAE